MPIYQYKCQECDHLMEAIQKMSDPVLQDCPQCNTPNLRKQLTAAAFKLKGTGWYETDFKNSGKKPAASNISSKTESNAETGASATTVNKADSKTGEAKPA